MSIINKIEILSIYMKYKIIMYLCYNCYGIISTIQKIGFNFQDNNDNTCHLCDNCYCYINSKLIPEIDRSKLVLLKAKINRINEQRNISTY